MNNRKIIEYFMRFSEYIIVYTRTKTQQAKPKKSNINSEGREGRDLFIIY